MDKIDTGLIAILRRNARASVSEISARLGVTRATVRARLEKLVESGEILGFTVVLKGDVYEQPVRGVMLIEIEGKGLDRIRARLEGMPEVEALHTTNGRWDLIIELGTPSLAELDAVLQRIRTIDGVTNSETSLYLATKRMNTDNIATDRTQNLKRNQRTRAARRSVGTN